MSQNRMKTEKTDGQ